MYDKERDMNPPEPREQHEPDVDAIGDEMWLRKKEEEEERQQQIIESCCQLGDVK
ncbi:hypothetical protein MEP401_gp08 [Methylophilales phage MEP401]|jgi:hypothetical protein|nr:hypothetical protein MEP401_gp08 [Methylophilales phage MEP401]